MGFHIEAAEMKQAVEDYQKQAKTAQEQLTQAKNAMNGIITSNAMYGQVGQAIAADINNQKNTVLVGLKNSYQLVTADLQKAYADFQATTGETSATAVLDEEVLTKAQTAITQFKSTHQEKRQTIQSTYQEIEDLISLSMPSGSSFTSACDEATKHLTKIVQKVNDYDSQQATSAASEILTALSQQLKQSESASKLSYSDPDFLAFASNTTLAEGIQAIDEQISQLEKQARLEAEATAKKKQAQWAKRHPIENFLQDMTEELGDWWMGVVEGTKNLALPEGFKTVLVAGEGAIGTIGETASTVAIGATQLVHLGVELVEWGIDSLRNVQTPQWKLEDIHGAGTTVKAIVQTAGNVLMSGQAIRNPWLLAVDPASRQAVSETFEMGRGIVTSVVNDVKSGDAYTIGGYIFDVASMFVGVGEVKAVLKGTTFAGKLTEGNKLSKLGKAATMANKTMKYGDDAAKALVKKLQDLPIPVLDEIALAGGGTVKVTSKGTLGDAMKLKKANFSNKGSGVVDDVAKEASKAVEKFKPQKTTLQNGEIAYKAKNGTLVRSPDYLDEAGNINWPKAQGFVTDANGQAIMIDANVKKGELLDRYGGTDGTFTSPLENGKPLDYDARGLPYPESMMDYHKYEIVRDINIKNVQQGFNNLNDLDRKMLDTLMDRYNFTLEDIANPQSGKISEVFGSGGGTQIKLGTSVEWYEKMGLIKEIK